MHPNDIPALVYALTMVVVTGLPLLVEAVEAAEAAAAAEEAAVEVEVEVEVAEVEVEVAEVEVAEVEAVGSRGVAAVQLVLPSRWTLSQRFGFGLQESPSLHFQELACSRFRIAIG